MFAVRDLGELALAVVLPAVDLAFHPLVVAAADGADKRMAVAADVAEGLERARVVDDHDRPAGDRAGVAVAGAGDLGGEAEQVPAGPKDRHLLALEPRGVVIRARLEQVIKFAREVEHDVILSPYGLPLGERDCKPIPCHAANRHGEALSAIADRGDSAAPSGIL